MKIYLQFTNINSYFVFRIPYTIIFQMPFNSMHNVYTCIIPSTRYPVASWFEMAKITTERRIKTNEWMNEVKEKQPIDGNQRTNELPKSSLKERKWSHFSQNKKKVTKSSIRISWNPLHRLFILIYLNNFVVVVGAAWLPLVVLLGHRLLFGFGKISSRGFSIYSWIIRHIVSRQAGWRANMKMNKSK